MTDLRIVDAPELDESEVQGGLKIPTGGFGNKAINMNTVASWVVKDKDLPSKSYVDTAVEQSNQGLSGHATNKNNPHGVTKSQVGLGNVNNTADADKPISNATSAALNLKADKTQLQGLATTTQLDLKADKTQLDAKADKSTTYTKTEVYSKDEVDSEILENGAALPYDVNRIYNDGVIVVDNGALKKVEGGTLVNAVDAASVSIGDSTLDVVSDNLLFTFNPLSSSINRVLYDKIIEQISIKDFGAIGDGTLHTAQEWVEQGKFNGLSAIQTVFPFVESLSDSIDWIAAQHAVNTCKNIYAPTGKYVLNKNIKSPHNTSPFNVASSGSGCKFFGDGVTTSFTRNNERATTRNYTADNASTTQESDTANQNESVFSIHCPYFVLSDLTIESSPVGIYLGQDFSQPFTSLSSVSKSCFKRLQINKCGTGVLFLAAGGNHYTSFTDIHFTSNQIDVHMRSSYWWKVTQGHGEANNNRNSFSKIRSGRSRVGFWNQCGDTNTLDQWHGEGINHTTANNPYPTPENMPTGVTNGSALFVFDKNNQLNTVTNCRLEQVDFHIYNDGANNTFTDNTINEGLCLNMQQPLCWLNRYAVRFRGVGYVDNNYPNLFSELPIAGALYLGLDSTNGIRQVSNDVWHTPTSNEKGSYSKKTQKELGVLAANTETRLQIWANSDPSSCAIIDVKLVGRCDVAGQISSFNTKVSVNAYRTTARALTRFGMTIDSNTRATYEDALDENISNLLQVSVSKNTTTPQILELVILSPFDLSALTAFIEISVMRS